MNRTQRWLADTRVRNKILVASGAVLLMMTTVTLVVLWQTVNIERLGRETGTAVELEVLGRQIDLALADRTSAFRDFLLSGQDSALTAYQQANTRLEQAVQRASTLTRDDTVHLQLDSLSWYARHWETEVATPGIALRRAVDEGTLPLDSVIEFFRSGVGRRGAARARQATQELQDHVGRLAERRGEERDRAVDRIQAVTVLATLLAALASFLTSIWLAGLISRSVRRAVEFAGAVAEGDLTQRLPVEGRDEIGELIGTLNRMADDLRRTVAGVSAATAQVATAAEEVAAASEQISQTADLQVRSTEETASSMEQIAAQIARVSRSTESLTASVSQTSSSISEMSTSVEQTAAGADALGASVEQTSATIEEMVVSILQVGRHVEETRVLARDAEGDARAGGEAVSATVGGMQRIHEETQSLVETMRQLRSTGEAVGRISEVIEDIADQTNLLALNAAIEAARAGEHGRGFTVVAQEIRRLAERSVESTREITLTIRSVLEDVSQAVQSTGEVAERTREGIALADQARGALEKIIGSAGRTRELMEEVALATQQQVQAAEQAQVAIRHIQGIAEQTRTATREQASTSRQIVAAVENMDRQTREVFAATEEQKRGGEMVLQATESVSQAARATKTAIQEMANAAHDLSLQANRLAELMSTFRV